MKTSMTTGGTGLPETGEERCASGDRSAPLATLESNGVKTRTKLPKMSRHSSGQARVCLNGKMHYLGAFESPEAHARYADLVQKWLSGGRAPLEPKLPHAGQAMLTVREMFDKYRAWLVTTGKYRKNGEETTQMHLTKDALASFERHAGQMRATKLGAAILVQWRDILEQQAKPLLTRSGINDKVAILLRALRWARVRGHLTRDVLLDCREIEPLKKGECGDRPEHGRQRRAVTMEEVEKVAAACTCRHVAAMLRVQAMLGCRPGEVCSMRWLDIDKTPVEVDGVTLWTYRVSQTVAKTAHHGRMISYPVPPAAQRILEEFPAPPAAYIFSPAGSMAERGRSHKTAPPFGSKWSNRAYRINVGRAIAVACKKANVAYFSPHEIRHGAITRAAEMFGVLAAQALANHKTATTTARYLHTDERAAYRVAAKVGKIG